MTRLTKDRELLIEEHIKSIKEIISNSIEEELLIEVRALQVDLEQERLSVDKWMIRVKSLERELQSRTVQFIYMRKVIRELDKKLSKELDND